MSLLPFGSAAESFDDPDSFVPESLPDPGPFLERAEVLTAEDHVAVHEWSHGVFEARGVYDVTFDYNLARLNFDRRHPDAGLRYARDGDELRAEFTPTTAFCPQAETLVVAAFRAYNGRGDGAETPAPPDDIARIRVRVAPMHRNAESINDRLRTLESTE